MPSAPSKKSIAGTEFSTPVIDTLANVTLSVVFRSWSNGLLLPSTLTPSRLISPIPEGRCKVPVLLNVQTFPAPLKSVVKTMSVGFTENCVVLLSLSILRFSRLIATPAPSIPGSNTLRFMSLLGRARISLPNVKLP